MDIKQIVNSKGGKGAVAAAAANSSAQDLQLLHSIQQSNSMSRSDAGSERGNSPHDSERSHYSASHYGPPMTGMNGSPNGMRYPSPTAAMQNPMPMMQQSYQPQPHYENPMMQQETSRPPRQTAQEGAPKAFPCSNCGKGFARRSDLARHGKLIIGTC